jgi:hypothetical protein
MLIDLCLFDTLLCTGLHFLKYRLEKLIAKIDEKNMSFQAINFVEQRKKLRTLN